MEQTMGFQLQHSWYVKQIHVLSSAESTDDTVGKSFDPEMSLILLSVPEYNFIPSDSCLNDMLLKDCSRVFVVALKKINDYLFNYNTTMITILKEFGRNNIRIVASKIANNCQVTATDVNIIMWCDVYCSMKVLVFKINWFFLDCYQYILLQLDMILLIKFSYVACYLSLAWADKSPYYTERSVIRKMIRESDMIVFDYLQKGNSILYKT